MASAQHFSSIRYVRREQFVFPRRLRPQVVDKINVHLQIHAHIVFNLFGNGGNTNVWMRRRMNDAHGYSIRCFLDDLVLFYPGTRLNECAGYAQWMDMPSVRQDEIIDPPPLN